MANVSVDSVTKKQGEITLKGKSVPGSRVAVEHDNAELAYCTAHATTGDWELTFTPPAGRSKVVAVGGGRGVTVNLSTAVVTYQAHLNS